MLYILELFVYIAVHFAAGRFGLYLNGLSAGHEVFFWPPAGISLAVLLLYGYRFLPGIFIGAFLVSLSSGVPLPVPFLAAIGSTLTPLIATYILKRFFYFQNSLERTKDVVALAFISFPISSIILASFMTVGFWRGGIISASQIPFTWVSIGLSNFLSSVIVGTFFLVWFTKSKVTFSKPKQIVEGILLSLLVVVLGVLMFTDIIDKRTPIAYFIFVPLIWSSLRFGSRETVTIVFVYSVLAIWSTLLGAGPVTVGAVNASLLYLQGFLSVASITSMILATTVSERKELEQRKDTFISMASHELKTPLTSMKMMTQLLQKMNPRDKAEKEKSYLANVNNQIDKITNLINDMLDLSKIQEGKLQLYKEKFSLSALVKETVETIQPAVSSHKILIKEKVNREVYADRDRIAQVLINLISNAVKYSPRANKVVISLSADKTAMTVSVKDFGIGISKNKINRIFERFYRAHEHNDKTFSGFGLGLYISAEIIKQHEGKIWVQSKEGKGSTFYFTLPLQ